jgi:hypothetical protein
MPTHVRVCRECGEEYRPGIVRCADCGGELEDRFLEEGDEPSGPAEAPAPAGPDLSRFRPIFMSGRAADLVPLAERLGQSEIGFHLAERPTPEGAPPSFSLLVHEDDAAKALAALGPLVAPQVEPDDVRGLETHFEDGRGYVRCPACGTEQAAGAAECHECGLVLGGGEVATCPRCGGPVLEAGATCPACGGAPAD